MKKTFVFLALLLLAAGCNKAQNNNQTPVEQTFRYENSYITGFEGDFYNVSYSLEYPIEKFMAVNDDSNKSRLSLREKANNNTHVLSIFYNGAAGMENSDQYFREVVKCTDCTASSKTFNLPEATDVKVYENSSSYYVVYAHDPGFIAWHLIKPTNEIEKVISTLKVTVTKTTENPMQ